MVPLAAPTIGRVGIMHKRTDESVISTDMVKEARRSTSAVEEKRRNKDGTACAFVGKRVCKQRCSATGDEQMRSGSKISGREFGNLYAEFSFLIFFDTKHQLRISNTFRETRCRRNKSSLLGRLRRTVILALLAFYSCTVCAHALLLSVTCV